MSAGEWIEGLNRIQTRKDLPITISGGEPTCHPGFYDIVKWIDWDINLDLLTNGKFSRKEFTSKISSTRFKRNAPYASIRFSYHPGYTNLFKLLYKVRVMQRKDYSVGIWAVDKTPVRNRIIRFLAQLLEIDFRLKEYLDSTHGHYKYPEALDGVAKNCLCKPSELLIAPDGRLFRCHHDLYHGLGSYGHILDSRVRLPEDYLPCSNYGLCNPCDIKSKFNRFQKEGHCSVTIKNG